MRGLLAVEARCLRLAFEAAAARGLSDEGVLGLVWEGIGVLDGREVEDGRN